MTSDDTMPHLFAEPPELAPLPTVEASSLPWLTVEQMAEADGRSRCSSWRAPGSPTS